MNRPLVTKIVLLVAVAAAIMVGVKMMRGTPAKLPASA